MALDQQEHFNIQEDSMNRLVLFNGYQIDGESETHCSLQTGWRELPYIVVYGSNGDEINNFFKPIDVFHHFLFEGVSAGLGYAWRFAVRFILNHHVYEYIVSFDAELIQEELLTKDQVEVFNASEPHPLRLIGPDVNSLECREAYNWLVDNIQLFDSTEDYYPAYQEQQKFLEAKPANTPSSILPIADTLATGGLIIMPFIEDTFDQQQVFDILKAFKQNNNGAMLITSLDNPTFIEGMDKHCIAIADSHQYASGFSKKQRQHMYNRFVEGKAGFIPKKDSLLPLLNDFAVKCKY